MALTYRNVEVIKPVLDDYTARTGIKAATTVMENIILEYPDLVKEVEKLRSDNQFLRRELDQMFNNRVRLSEALKHFLEPLDPERPTCKTCACWDFNYNQAGIAVGDCDHPESHYSETNESDTCHLHEAE